MLCLVLGVHRENIASTMIGVKRDFRDKDILGQNFWVKSFIKKCWQWIQIRNTKLSVTTAEHESFWWIGEYGCHAFKTFIEPKRITDGSSWLCEWIKGLLHQGLFLETAWNLFDVLVLPVLLPLSFFGGHFDDYRIPFCWHLWTCLPHCTVIVWVPAGLKQE